MIIDSGNRKEFDSGAVRDAREGVGRCDLLPLSIIASGYPKRTRQVFEYIDMYINTGNPEAIHMAIFNFVMLEFSGDYETAILEVSKHFEEGCNKYGARNWQKGIPLHCYIDSGVRHYLKYLRGDTDERHDRAFLWNMYCALWTQRYRRSMIDIPFNKVNKETDELKREIRRLHQDKAAIDDKIQEIKDELNKREMNE